MRDIIVSSLKGVRGLIKQPRIEAVDLLRGLFIVVMIIDHIARFPNGLDYFAGRNALWFSAAEGFVMLSGLLVGYIYMPKIAKNPKLVFKKLLKRALVLYLCVIGLSLFFIYYSIGLFAATDFTQFHSTFDLLLQLLTLQYNFGWAEFLTHYVVFLIFAPLVLYAFSKNWTIPVLTVSIILWLIGLQLSDGQTRYEFTMSWQLLFVLGIFIGTRFKNIKSWLRKRIAKRNRERLLYVLWISAILVYVSTVTLAYGAEEVRNNLPLFKGAADTIMNFWTPINNAWFSWWSDKSTLAPIRLISGAIIFWALFTFFDRYHKKIDTITFHKLGEIGKKPLVAYSVGALVIFAIEKYIPKPLEENRHFIANLIVTIVALVFTYLITKNSSSLRKVIEGIYRR